MIYLLEPIASFQIDSSEELFKKKIAPPERSITALLEKKVRVLVHAKADLNLATDGAK